MYLHAHDDRAQTHVAVNGEDRSVEYAGARDNGREPPVSGDVRALREAMAFMLETSAKHVEQIKDLRERVAALEGAKCSRLDDMLAAIADLQTVSNQRGMVVR